VRTSHLPIPFVVAFLVACNGAEVPDDEAVASTSQAWDSQAGNPTHATHSYLTEYAIDALRTEYPELEAFRAKLVDGANLELHELPLDDAELEALRIRAGGTNWGADHPDLVWADATDAYRAGDKAKGYRYLGIVLHWVEDMAGPAHAFHVIHQSSPFDWDHFEVLSFWKWAPSYEGVTTGSPGLATPDAFVEWSGAWARSDFQAAFPGVTYTRTLFPLLWIPANGRYQTFAKQRQGRAALTTRFALESAARAWLTP
jgi:hypothetical protein